MTGDTDEPTAADAASPEAVERLAREFEAAGRPYARVTVVRREAPVSANVGDRALVTPDGDLIGWIGGVACAQSVVVREATAALRRGEPRLVGLAPDPEAIARPGLAAFPMTCHSEGTLELFVEPVIPVPRLVVVGDSSLSRALVRLAAELSYEVVVVADAIDAGDDGFEGVDRTLAPDEADDVFEGASFVVAASMDDASDERGIERALRADVPYVALVASGTRAESLFGRVAARLDTDDAAVADAVTSPAGLDIGARTPEEIAVSVLAELVAVRRSGSGDRDAGEAIADAVSDHTDADVAPDDATDGGDDRVADDADGDATTTAETTTDADDADGDDAETAVDPVCGMAVTVGEAATTVTVEGRTYHFCGQACADAFAADPERYLDTGEVV